MHCFKHLGTQLNELHSVIARMLQEEFVKLVKQELYMPLDADACAVVDEVRRLP